MFNGRRQSQDRSLRKWLLSFCGNNKIYMTRYTAEQFDDAKCISICTGFENMIGENDFYFVEDGNYDLEQANEIILCNWNRSYPADVYFPSSIEILGFSKKHHEEIKGHSHEKISIEIYKRKHNAGN